MSSCNCLVLTYDSFKEVIGIILAVSAGGIFYMLHYDMIPKAHKERKWLPTFGAVLGFIIGFALVRVIG
jgi:zinc transporter, ZIP family